MTRASHPTTRGRFARTSSPSFHLSGRNCAHSKKSSRIGNRKCHQTGSISKASNCPAFPILASNHVTVTAAEWSSEFDIHALLDHLRSHIFRNIRSHVTATVCCRHFVVNSGRPDEYEVMNCQKNKILSCLLFHECFTMDHIEIGRLNWRW